MAVLPLNNYLYIKIDMWLFGKKEPFVNDTQARSDIITTFITISIVFFGMALAFILLWSYNKSDKLFFMVFSGMVALYATAMSIFVAIIRSNITSIQFKVFMMSSIFMGLMSVILLIIFVVKSTYLFKNIDTRPERSSPPPPPPPPPPQQQQMYSREDIDADNDLYEERRF
jgi:hypothetical protein